MDRTNNRGSMRAGFVDSDMVVIRDLTALQVESSMCHTWEGKNEIVNFVICKK